MVLEEGISSYVIVTIPPRHGKSDTCSRTWPVFHLGRNPTHEVILSSYNYDLASSMSYDARALMARVGPALFGLSIERARSALSSWRLHGYPGACHAAGIGGTITGRGAHILVVDDYFKNREEAESETIRQKKWESFESDLLTRLAPAHAVVIVANRWHEDDIVGRILDRNNPNHENYNAEFPRFECINFPAWSEEYGWLFPERFDEQWYLAQRAFMGTYAWNAQGLQEPRPRTGNMLRADLVRMVKPEAVPEGLRWRRGWDLASSEKEVVKDDPDYTVGTLAAYDRKTNRIFIQEVIRGQWSALKRKRRMVEAAKRDGRSVHVKVEVVGAYLDAYNIVKNALKGRSIVRKVTAARDKVARASALEAIFEAGNVNVVTPPEGGAPPWFHEWKTEFLGFPRGKHDDQVDSLLAAVLQDVNGAGRMGVGT
jgi:predicted phage terminase large subunit-like protein